MLYTRYITDDATQHYAYFILNKSRNGVTSYCSTFFPLDNGCQNKRLREFVLGQFAGR